MAQSYKKGLSVKASEHFSSEHFDCRCSRKECTETLIDFRLAIALDELWDLAGPFIIDSGYRCAEHNQEVGGAKDSQHLLGFAADCRSLIHPGEVMAQLAEQVAAFQNGGIGKYNLFAHCDVRLGRARWDLRK